MPIPLQRNIPNSNRRNEYVNMPVNSHPMPQNHDLNSLSSASPDLSNPPPLPPHNYANMPLNKNPMPPPRQEDPPMTHTNQPRKFSQFRNSRFNEPSSDQETLGYNDTQTLRADQRLEYPPPPKDDPYGSSDHGDGPARPHFRQVHLDYDSNQTKAEPQQASRVPIGNMRRENRASLRAKHRKDMEQANSRVRYF